MEIAVEAALEAGKVIMDIYESEDFQVESKEDLLPITIADKKATDIINQYLVLTGIPIISEENQQVCCEERKNWESCWIVDPLDGTKEFIKRNGEFTVNIAFIKNGEPGLGVIYAPALDVLYYALVEEEKAFKVEKASMSSNPFLKGRQIKPSTPESTIKIVCSRSHMNEDTLEFIERLKKENQCEVEVVSKGSSLKFCLIAEGEADMYPRYAPTMEWDTAAGQAICEAVRFSCCFRETGGPMNYNRENLLNPHFLVSYAK